MDEMRSVKEKLGKESEQSNTVQTMAEVINSGLRQAGRREGQQATLHVVQCDDHAKQEEIRSIISLSRRTVGLQKIDKHDLARMRQVQYGGAKSEEEEKLYAVQEFLQLEIKLSETTIKKMEIEKNFAPAAKENRQWLYVIFREEVTK